MIIDLRGFAHRRRRSATTPEATSSPAAHLEAMYLRRWTTRIRELPFVNLALSVETIGFRRWSRVSTPSGPGAAPPRLAGTAEWSLPGDGDWLGSVVTPWLISLVLVPGSARAWPVLGSGDRCRLVFPVGPLDFIFDQDATAEVPEILYCPLFSPPGQFGSQAAARAAAAAALEALCRSPGPPASGRSAGTDAADPRLSRRSFLRRMVGSREGDPTGRRVDAESERR
ncbi:[NiFe]-hydrogenase assembly chaperone HybE [Accumulibacter sp.]|uniref:[NiFe]-hydrogenase assembly chaperone HybE n=1 Tax=Accumulibacter sp. TaxID=2053492 RepID=UPI0025CFD8DF|nr:[NiFe]-hydrogenase assembly chaperone HybE [Accumulibacter sp.]MCM8596862.1 [NiFe]-hydrogenase assembly chaperone HybE [Accumulibacter sp.]MCM8624604.1 [NiFe]-hydrogenase assembly chaperone HybE [Accumulibacter sp.]MDS4051010.1 [NiFe]-hydrogenase assembly chaperone HybE [Accumulibacter sp.]